MRRETVIGIAIEVFGNGTGIGLQMTGITSPALGWIIIGVSSVLGTFLIGYGLGKRSDDYIRFLLTKPQPQLPTMSGADSEDVESEHHKWQGFSKAEMAQVTLAAKQMIESHGHVDWTGLMDAQRRGVSFNDVCWLCGKPRFQKGDSPDEGEAE